MLLLYGIHFPVWMPGKTCEWRYYQAKLWRQYLLRDASSLPKVKAICSEVKSPIIFHCNLQCNVREKSIRSFS